MPPISKSKTLLQLIDRIIEKHAFANPELFSDLQELRTELQDALHANSKTNIAKIALKIALLIKFIHDHIPPPDI